MPAPRTEPRTERFRARAFLRDLPIPRKLTLVIALFCVVIFGLLGLSYFGLAILSGSRAYVGGEGLWSKAQKGAVYRLTRYAQFHDEADYRHYLEHIAVSQGDHIARLEMARPHMDTKVVQQGLLQGRNHPDDVRIMTFMARHFHEFRYMRDAIELWAQADGYIEQLKKVAEELRREILSGSPSETRIRALLADINTIDEQVTEVEDAFSYTLGEGARWLKKVLFVSMLAATALFLAMVLAIAFFISRHLSREIEQLRVGAARIAGGDYSIELNVAARDEVGDLARSFQEMAAQRQRAERVKDEFFANVSHELRTPLTLILSPLESLLAGDYGVLDARATPALQTMHNNTVRLLQLVNGLLDFSKLEAGQLHVNREPVCLVGITQAMFTDFQPLFRERRLHARFTSDCPPQAVMLDRYLYERILFNLLSNAAKFTPPNGRIDVHVAWTADKLRLSVTDSGIGIPAEQLTTIFERFRQVEGSSTRRFEGTGLGLALVKEFAELLEGTVEVDSVPARGSAFTVVCAAPNTQAPAIVGRTSAASNVHPLSLNLPSLASVISPSSLPAELEQRASVLIAEDNAEMASYIASLLQPFASVRIARDGDVAWQILQHEPIELVITDVMMPARDGIDLCRQIKANPKTASIPVAMLTALTHRDALLEGWKVGADEYLFKPFHPRELVTRAQSLLKSYRQKKAADECIADLNRDLTQRASDLEAANHELEAFSYSVSHDLRGPLRIVVGYSEMLLDSHAQELDTEGQRMLTQVRDASQRMGQLIDALLKLSSIHHSELERSPIDVSGLAHEVVEELKLREPARKIRIDIQAGLSVKADSRLLRIVLDNLIGNAWKFTAKKSDPHIELHLENQSDGPVFAVRDNGAGFSMNYARKLFFPFQRLHTKDEFPGSGIGLATARRIVDLHGGKIWGHSEPGQGATFYFTLGERATATEPGMAAALG